MLRRSRLNPISKKRRERSGKGPKGFKTLPDGREICYSMGAGPGEYRRRTKEAGERQGWICCLFGHAPMCPGRMDWHYGEGPMKVTLEHQDGRGMNGGHRDDRIWKPDPETGEMKPYNGAAHMVCNQWKGSRRIDYNSALQERKPDAQ